MFGTRQKSLWKKSARASRRAHPLFSRAALHPAHARTVGYARIALAAPAFIVSPSWRSAGALRTDLKPEPSPERRKRLAPPGRERVRAPGAEAMADAGTSGDIDWSAITAKLPVGRDTASSMRRAELFERFDVNKNGVLSLGEADRAIREVMGFDTLSKAVLMRAFNAARDANKSKKPKRKRKDDYVERDEFRVLLVYLRQYFELYVAFNRLDTNQDQRLDLVEFRNSLDTLAKWGINVKPEEAEAEFQKIDVNGGGAVLFDEFCHWAIGKNLDLEDDDDFEDEAGIGFKSSEESAGLHLLNKAKANATRASATVLPMYRGKLAQEVANANLMHSKIVSSAQSREEAAREKLNRLKAQAQKELNRAAARAATEQKTEARRQEVARVRAETDMLIGRDITAKVREVPALDDQEIEELSKLFNAQMQNMDDKKARNFIWLFKEMDIDGSRRIAFNELERMVRGKFNLPVKQLSQNKLYGLWKVLDENSSGFIDTGELSRFLRIGAPKTMSAVERARIKLQQAREARMARIKADTDKVTEKDVVTSMSKFTKATDDEIARFGALFLKQLSILRPRGQDNISYYGLFKRMDEDGSGKVTFDEFLNLIRRGMNVDAEQMPYKTVAGLWKAIDEDNNGFVVAGEFCQFMRLAAESNQGALGKTANFELQMKAREDAAHAQLKRQETWARNTSSSALTAAKAMEEEAKRLEALLANVSKRGISEAAKPSRGMMVSRSSASIVRAAGRAEAAEDAEVPEEDINPHSPSPVKRMEAIKMLAREMKTGGGRARVQANGSRSVPILLRSFAKEEGQI